MSRSLPLLAAELGGYLLSILLLRSVLGPLMAEAPLLGAALRVAVAIYLVHLAGRLWRHGARDIGDRAPVTFGRVLITTLLNPKAIIFAFTLLPLQIGGLDLLPWLRALAALIVTIGACWIALGASLGRGLEGIGHPELIYRSGAIALLVLAGIIGAHSVGIA